MTNSPTSLNASDYLKLDDLEQIVLTEAQRRHDTNRIADIYPDEGSLRRELYPKHIAFFKAGATHMERAAIAANRVGKTWGIGGYETTVHLTGDYPPWWEGRRFDRPVDVWAAGDTSETTRDIVQLALMGRSTPSALALYPPTRSLETCQAIRHGQFDRHRPRPARIRGNLQPRLQVLRSGAP